MFWMKETLFSNGGFMGDPLHRVSDNLIQNEIS